MRAVLPGSVSRPARWARGAAVLAVGLALSALAATAADGLDAEGRARLVRYVGILISAAFAIGMPHLLYPDPAAERLQLANPGAGRLLRRQVARVAPALAVLSLPALAVALGGAGWAVAVEGVLAVWAVGLYALARSAPLGLRSLAWERGEAGGWYRTLRRRAPALQFQVPDPLVPGLLVTGDVFLLGSTLAIYGQAVGAGWGIAGPVTALGLAGLALGRQAEGFDRAFWVTNGVLTDAFRTTETGDGERGAVTYDAVYWAPPRLRPAVWASLVSMDRRLPLGRLAVGGLAFVAAVAFAGAPGRVFAAAVLLWTVAVNGAVALTARPALVPSALAYRLHGGAGWSAVRFLANVRWLPLLVAVLALLAWLTDLTAGAIVEWSVVYIAVAVVSAVGVTVLSRSAFRRAVA